MPTFHSTFRQWLLNFGDEELWQTCTGVGHCAVNIEQWPSMEHFNENMNYEK